jgi:Tol biopolymer transport system component
MVQSVLLALALAAFLLFVPPVFAPENPLLLPEERRHMSNLKQLTFGGENAEAYFSRDGKWLIFQARPNNEPADQIFIMGIDGKNKRMVSTGTGWTTCSYFFPNGKEILYTSTHEASPEAPPRPDRKKGYVWPIYPTAKIYKASRDGKILKCLTPWDGYNAEATVSPDGKKIIFTSSKDGDLDLYVMDSTGKNVKRITNTLGYDGGAFFSHKGKLICWRAARPKTEEEIAQYKSLLSENLVMPAKLEIFVANADGTNVRQLTNNGAANFAPYFLPDDSGVIFSSNMHSKRAGMPNFDLFIVKLKGGEPERVTYDEMFDGFPMFSPDGKKLVFCANRGGKKFGETNVFICDWKP